LDPFILLIFNELETLVLVDLELKGWLKSPSIETESLPLISGLFFLISLTLSVFVTLMLVSDSVIFCLIGDF
jgi:hypothetical protein